MRLTIRLFKKLAPGKITTGKHRFIRPIRNSQKLMAANRSIREQRNMSVLSEPFLNTEEEKYLNGVILRAERIKQMEDTKNNFDKRLMFENRTLVSHLNLLNTSKAWE